MEEWSKSIDLHSPAIYIYIYMIRLIHIHFIKLGSFSFKYYLPISNLVLWKTLCFSIMKTMCFRIIRKGNLQIIYNFS